jgi:hypothetical protein
MPTELLKKYACLVDFVCMRARILQTQLVTDIATESIGLPRYPRLESRGHYDKMG